ncbi:MAG: response regulator [Chloroflexota bacterium]
MTEPIRVMILEDHFATAEGYRSRLSLEQDIQVVDILAYGEDLIPALDRQEADVLILDIRVLRSATNKTPFTTVHLVPQLLNRYPKLVILVLTMFETPSMINTLLNNGVNGYVLKDDYEAFRAFPEVIRLVAGGSMYISQRASEHWERRPGGSQSIVLGPRQIEALSLCASYPNERLGQLAARMNVASSTIRGILLEIYRKLGVNTRSAAVSKAREVGLLPPDQLTPNG